MSTANPSWADATHLVRRFFSVWTAVQLSPAEQDFVAQLLTPAEADVFWRQPTSDIRHGHDCAQSVAAARPDRQDLIRAALLHDVGKYPSQLGPFGRSLATVFRLLGIRGSDRHHSYNRHAEEGARLLAEAGAEPSVVEYTLRHHGERPTDFPPDDWAVLAAADHQH